MRFTIGISCLALVSVVCARKCHAFEMKYTMRFMFEISALNLGDFMTNAEIVNGNTNIPIEYRQT